MEKLEKNNLKGYLKENFSVEDALTPFIKSLQNVADSSMVFYGYERVPINAKWDSESDEVAWINDKECYINLDNPLVHDLSFVDRKTCIVGEMVHEIFGHWLHTDFKTISALLDSGDFDKYFSQYDNFTQIKKYYTEDLKSFGKLFFMIGNIVEDPVIEYLAVQKYPGFAFYVDSLTERLRNHLNESTQLLDFDNLSLQDVCHLVLCKARHSFLPQNKNIDFLSEFDFFDNLSSMPNYEDRLNATAFIISKIWSYVETEIENQSQMQQLLQQLEQMLNETGVSCETQRTQNGQANSSQNNSEQNDSSSDKSSPQQNNENEQKGDDSSKKDKGDTYGQQGISNEQQGEKQGSKEQEDQQSSQSSNSIGNSLSASPDDFKRDLLNSALNELEQSVNENTKEYIDKMFAQCDKSELDKLQGQMEEVNIKQFIHNDNEVRNEEITVCSRYSANVDEYKKMFTPQKARIAKTLAKSVSKALKDKRKRKILYGIDDGTIFDVHSYANGSEKVFMDIKRPDKNPICSVAVMVDMSGSMSGDRSIAATDTAMILDQFCKELKIPSLTYGHSYSSGTTIRKFKDFSENTIKSSSKLSHLMEVGSCNHDGVALRYGLSKLAKRPENQKFLFVISDGRPNASGYGTTQMKRDMQKINKTAKKYNIAIIPIAIGDDIDTLTNIYGRVVDGRDLNKLSKEVTKLLLKQIKKLI